MKAGCGIAVFCIFRNLCFKIAYFCRYAAFQHDGEDHSCQTPDVPFAWHGGEPGEMDLNPLFLLAPLTAQVATGGFITV